MLNLYFRSQFVESFDRLSFQNNYFDSGKVDFHYLNTKISNMYNFIWWSPIFKGGFGLVDYNLSGNIKYNGGYFSSFLPEDGKGELILGFLEVNSNSTNSYEFQGEYRLPCGLGLGGGAVSKEERVV